MYYFILGLVVGVAIATSIFIFWIERAKAGEIQVYDYENEIYPVLAVKSKKDFEKRYLLLKLVRYGQSRE